MALSHPRASVTKQYNLVPAAGHLWADCRGRGSAAEEAYAHV